MSLLGWRYMKHVVFLSPNKAGPDKNTGMYRGVLLVGGPNYYKERVKTKIKRRGSSGEGRERKGECIQKGAVHSFVVQVVSQIIR